MILQQSRPVFGFVTVEQKRLHVLSASSASLQSNFPSCPSKRQASEVIPVLKHLFEILSRLLSSQASMLLAAWSLFISSSEFSSQHLLPGAEFRQPPGTSLEIQSNLPTNAKLLQAAHICVSQRKKAGIRNLISHRKKWMPGTSSILPFWGLHYNRVVYVSV